MYARDDFIIQGSNAEHLFFLFLFFIIIQALDILNVKIKILLLPG